ncbi:MAG: hypothetical protein D6702_07065 [Planctomycetota bacterium]|nr:MAG: hypothetical protein D6702_07065 [Planctomycetota bacterium]
MAGIGSRSGRGAPVPPLAGLLLALAACGPAGGGDDGGRPGRDLGASFEVAVSGEERSGADQPATPAAFGLPFPAGEPAAAGPLELELEDGRVLPAAGRVLARWPDGSVRWLLAELIAPALPAGGALAGTLRPRRDGLLPTGELTVQPAAAGAPLTVRTEALEFRDAGGNGLFELDGRLGGGLTAPAAATVSTPVGDLRVVPGGAFAVEHEGELSVTLLRRDDLEDAGGRAVARLTTRATIWRGQPLVRIRHTLDVLAGSLEVTSWRLELPLAAPGPTARLVDADGSVELIPGDFDRRQIGPDTLRRDGVDAPGRLPGVVGFAGTLLELRSFWQLHPDAIVRSGDLLRLDLCPEVDGRGRTLDEGFGRTRELWLTVGPAADAREPEAVAAAAAAPLLLHADASWYCRSGALGPLGEALPGDNTALEEKLAQSTDLVLWRRDLDPAHNYGLADWGDFYDGENGISYSGALQQEYDPAWVVLLQFLRTGDVDYLQPGLELAWHYADVDIAWYGGCFQHRATSNRVRSHIARICGAGRRAEWEAWPDYDGTLENAFAWLATAYFPEFADRMRSYLAPEQSRGAAGGEAIERLFAMVGQYEVDKVGENLDLPAGSGLRDVAVWYAAQPRIQALGFTDPDSQFADFFARYGGSWTDFPSFHVDDLPIPQFRHEGGHQLVEGVVLAHLLTGAPRLRDAALACGRHLAEEVVPWTLQTQTALRDGGGDPLHVREVGWPLIGLLRVLEICENMPGEADLATELEAAARDCVDFLVTVPVDRYESTIHAGVALEGLVAWDRRTADPTARAALHDLARTWAANQYDWANHAFRYKANGPTETYKGMSGLMVLGLACSESLEHDPGLRAVLDDAWANLPGQSSYAKAYAMLYRGAGRALGYLRDLPPISP